VISYDAIGFVYTRRCPLACRDCITESSPHARGKMRPDQAKAYLSAVGRFAGTVCFTGGEPLLYHQEIAGLTRFAKTCGLRVSVVTGAGWVRSESIARRRMRELGAAGLDDLAISWDVYHEEFSDRERAVLLARVATEEGLCVTVRSVEGAQAESAAHRHDFAGLPVHFESIRLVRLGRAASLPAAHFVAGATPPMGRCSAVLSAAIDCDGTVYACGGPSCYSARPSPLVLGNAGEEPLDTILDRAVRDPLLEVIALLGPYGLHLLLQGTGVADLYRERASYSGICDLCLDLTDSPAIVTAIRNRLDDERARALLTAARLRLGLDDAYEPDRADAPVLLGGRY
jgi:hypothetical protein